MHAKDLLEFCAASLQEVLKFDRPADAVLAHLLQDDRRKSRLGSRDRFAVTETVFVVLRRRYLFEAFCQSAPKSAGQKFRRLALLGFPDSPEVFASVLTEEVGQWLLVCRALDPYSEDSGLLDRHRHNLPDWIAEILREQLGPEFWPLVRSLDQQAPLDLRVNVLTTRRDAAIEELASHGIACQSMPYSPWGLRLKAKPALRRLAMFERGDIEVQDEGSQLLALLLEAKRGEMVVDFCAGAGGKTLALGANMRNTGRLYAFDTSAHRLEAFKSRLGRSGLSNVHPVAIAHERDERVKRLAGKIDRVLVDAPCSGLGTLRRHPDLKWRQTPENVLKFAEQQRSILESASRLLKPGGRLIYATCSLLPAENEAIAHDFSAQHPAFEPLEVADILSGLKVQDPESLCQGRFLQLWPHRHQTDAFFAAVWKRSE